MMDDEMRAGETEEESRQRRQQALRSLAQDGAYPATGAKENLSASSAGAAFPMSSSPSPRRRRWIAALIVALCVVVLASLGYFAFLRPTTPTTPTTASTEKPISGLAAQDNLTCIQDMAVSPDGASVAILGYYRRCASEDIANYGYQPGQINIYAVNSGQLTATLHPDDPISSALHPQLPPGVHPAQPGADVSHVVINYLNMFWSADSSQLALTFNISTYASATPANGAPTAITDGVLLTDSKVATPRVLAHTQSPYVNSSDTWNATTDAYIPIPANVDQSRPWSPVAPALGYTWDATGALVPQGPTLTTTAPAPSAPALGAIGSSIGGRSFTIWQPGQVSFLTDPSSSNPSTPTPGLYQFFTDFPVWSPDGSWLYVDMHVYDVIVADGQTLPAAGSAAAHQIGQGIPVLPMRDKGLAAALATRANPQYITENGAAMSLAWRPDGRVLAIIVPPAVVPGKVALAPAGVDLYDCATGKLLKSLRQQSSPNGQSDQVLMLWTSDGKHLVLLDTATGYFTIWGSDQLPKA